MCKRLRYYQLVIWNLIDFDVDLHNERLKKVASHINWTIGTMYSKYVHHSSFNSQHNQRTLYDHLILVGISHLTMTMTIFIWTLKMAMDAIWNQQSSHTNCMFHVSQEVGAKFIGPPKRLDECFFPVSWKYQHTSLCYNLLILDKWTTRSLSECFLIL